jgi:hypothetical protein
MTQSTGHAKLIWTLPWTMRQSLAFTDMLCKREADHRARFFQEAQADYMPLSNWPPARARSHSFGWRFYLGIGQNCDIGRVGQAGVDTTSGAMTERSKRSRVGRSGPAEGRYSLCLCKPNFLPVAGLPNLIASISLSAEQLHSDHGLGPPDAGLARSSSHDFTWIILGCL